MKGRSDKVAHGSSGIGSLPEKSGFYETSARYPHLAPNFSVLTSVDPVLLIPCQKETKKKQLEAINASAALKDALKVQFSYFFEDGLFLPRSESDQASYQSCPARFILKSLVSRFCMSGKWPAP